MIDSKRITDDLEKLYEGIEPYCCSQVDKTFRDAISALKQKSEAERWIERIKSLCAEQGCELRGEGFEWSDGCAAGRVALSEEILEILEGKAE